MPKNKLARRAKPLPVRVRDSQFVCPYCGARDRIHEEEAGTRQNTVTLEGDRVVVGFGDGYWDHGRYFCECCNQTVELPPLLAAANRYF